MKTGSMDIVGGCDFFGAGFSCRSRSKLNKNRADFVGCCAAGSTSGETGFTWEAVRGYIKRGKPRVVVLENVMDLMQTYGEQEESDATHVVRAMTEMGYAARWVVIEASNHGSIAVRERLYLVAFFVGMDQNDGLLGQGQLLLCELEELITSCYISDLPIGDFVCAATDPVLATAPGYHLPEDRASWKKGTAEDCKYVAEHTSIFAASYMKYPPDTSNLNISLQEAQL
jgi:site-specific DNA-cytosine methylase